MHTLWVCLLWILPLFFLSTPCFSATARAMVDAASGVASLSKEQARAGSVIARLVRRQKMASPQRPTRIKSKPTVRDAAAASACAAGSRRSCSPPVALDFDREGSVAAAVGSGSVSAALPRFSGGKHPVETLPEDALSAIFSYLEPEEVARFKVSRNTRSAVGVLEEKRRTILEQARETDAEAKRLRDSLEARRAADAEDTTRAASASAVEGAEGGDVLEELETAYMQRQRRAEKQAAAGLGSLPVSAASLSEFDARYLERTASELLKQKQPQKAYALLQHNGISIDRVPDSNTLSSYIVLLQTAQDLGNTQQVLHGTKLLLGQSAEKPHVPWLPKVSPAPKELLRVHELHATAMIRAGSTADAKQAISAALKVVGEDTAAEHRLRALFAELSWLNDSDGDFIDHIQALLDSPTLPPDTKLRVAKRAGALAYLDENFDLAARHFKRIVESDAPSRELYASAVSRLFETNVRRSRPLENLRMAYEALASGHLSLQEQRNLRQRILNTYGTVAEQEILLESVGLLVRSRILEEYLELEKIMALVGSRDYAAALEMSEAMRGRMSKWISSPSGLIRQFTLVSSQLKMQYAAATYSLDVTKARALMKEATAELQKVPHRSLLPNEQFAFHVAQAHVFALDGNLAASLDEMWQALRLNSEESLIEGALLESPFYLHLHQSYEVLAAKVRMGSEGLTLQQRAQFQLLQLSMLRFQKKWTRSSKLVEEIVEGMDDLTHEQQAQTRLMLAELHKLRSGKQAEAAKFWEGALKGSKGLSARERARGHMWLSRFYHKQKRLDATILHASRALKGKGLSKEQRAKTELRLAKAYLTTNNPSTLPDAVDLLFRAGRSGVFNEEEYYTLNLTLARALVRQGRHTNNTHYFHQAYQYYDKAVAAQTIPSHQLRKLLKEKTDIELEVFTKYDGSRPAFDPFLETRIENSYKSLLSKLMTVDDPRMKAEVHLNLGTFYFYQKRKFTQRKAMEQYTDAGALKAYLSPQERALLDLRTGINNYRRYHETYNPQVLRMHVMGFLDRALGSRLLKPEEMFEAHQYRARMLLVERKPADAYHAYQSALRFGKAVRDRDVLLARKEAAEALERSSSFKAAAEEYDAILKDVKKLPSWSDQEVYKVYLARAQSRYYGGNAAQALKDIEGLRRWGASHGYRLNEGPNLLANVIAARLKAQALMRLNRGGDALEVFVKDYIPHEPNLQIPFPFNSADDWVQLIKASVVEAISSHRYDDMVAVLNHYQRREAITRHDQKGVLSFLQQLIAVEQGVAPATVTADNLQRRMRLLTRVRVNQGLTPRQQQRFQVFAQHTIAKKYYKEAEYESAAEYFRGALRDLPGEDAAEHAQLNYGLALSLAKQKNDVETRALLRTVDLGHLNAEQKRKRLGILGDIAYRRKEYHSAATFYEQTRTLHGGGARSYSFSWLKAKVQAARGQNVTRVATVE